MQLIEAESFWFLGRNLLNRLIELNRDNENGQYNKLITAAITNFCEEHPDMFVHLCLNNSMIYEYCDGPIPELLEYWGNKVDSSNKEEEASLQTFLNAYNNNTHNDSVGNNKVSEARKIKIK